MSIQCPADGCDFTGMLDAVQGHVGGSGDTLHDGLAPPDVRAGLDQGEGPAEGSQMPSWVVVAVALVLVLLVVHAHTSDWSESEDRDEPAERVDSAALRGR